MCGESTSVRTQTQMKVMTQTTSKKGGEGKKTAAQLSTHTGVCSLAPPSHHAPPSHRAVCPAQISLPFSRIVAASWQHDMRGSRQNESSVHDHPKAARAFFSASINFSPSTCSKSKFSFTGADPDVDANVKSNFLHRVRAFSTSCTVTCDHV